MLKYLLALLTFYVPAAEAASLVNHVSDMESFNKQAEIALGNDDDDVYSQQARSTYSEFSKAFLMQHPDDSDAIMDEDTFFGLEDNPNMGTAGLTNKTTKSAANASNNTSSATLLPSINNRADKQWSAQESESKTPSAQVKSQSSTETQVQQTKTRLPLPPQELPALPTSTQNVKPDAQATPSNSDAKTLPALPSIEMRADVKLPDNVKLPELPSLETKINLPTMPPIDSPPRTTMLQKTEKVPSDTEETRVENGVIESPMPPAVKSIDAMPKLPSIKGPSTTLPEGNINDNKILSENKKPTVSGVKMNAEIPQPPIAKPVVEFNVRPIPNPSTQTLLPVEPAKTLSPTIEYNKIPDNRITAQNTNPLPKTGIEGEGKVMPKTQDEVMSNLLPQSAQPLQSEYPETGPEMPAPKAKNRARPTNDRQQSKPAKSVVNVQTSDANSALELDVGIEDVDREFSEIITSKIIDREIWSKETSKSQGSKAKIYSRYPSQVMTPDQLNRGFVNKDEYKKYIFYAVATGDTGAVDALLSVVGDTEVRNKFGDTPLIYAAKIGSVKMTRYMIVKGADIDAKNNKGLTTMDIAKKLNLREIISALNEVRR